eukprot:4250069-Amphidinium_carterae.1
MSVCWRCLRFGVSWRALIGSRGCSVSVAGMGEDDTVMECQSAACIWRCASIALGVASGASCIAAACAASSSALA